MRLNPRIPTPDRTVPAAVAALCVLVLFCSCSSVQPPTTYRGRQIDSELVDKTHEPGLTVSLLPSADGRCRLRIEQYEIVTRREIPIYEKVLEYRPQDSANRDDIRHEVVSGEVLRGEPQERTERHEKGPLANEPVEVNGRLFATDERGVITDEQDHLLSLFDEPYSREAEVAVRHSRLGRATLTLTKEELLRSLAVNLSRGAQASNAGLRVHAEPRPASPRPGERIVITLSAENRGPRFISRVEARSFSRLPWLDGRNFYIGGLNPGQRKTFSRTFRVPHDQKPGACFVEIGVWDLLGADPKRNLPLTLTVQ